MKQGIQPSLDSYGELSTAGGGFGFQISCELKPLRQLPLIIGVDYKHRIRLNLTGSGHFVVACCSRQYSAAGQPGCDSQAHPPGAQAQCGYRLPPVKPLLLAGTYSFDRYSVYEQDLFQGDKGTSIAVPRNYGNGYTFRLGAEYTLRGRIDLRVGGLRDVWAST